MIMDYHIVHSLPGRVRLRCATSGEMSKYRPEAVEQAIYNIKGVTAVKANNVTDSILINYDVEETSEVKLLPTVFELSLDKLPGTIMEPKSMDMGWAKNLFGLLYNKYPGMTLKIATAMLPIVLKRMFAVGKKIRKEKR